MIGPPKDATSRRLVWLVLFTAVIAGTLYAMARVARAGFPVATFLVLCGVPAVGVGWWLRRELGRLGIYGGILVGHLAAVVLLSANRGRFALYAFLALVIPVAVGLYLLRPSITRATGSTVAACLLIGVFSVAVVGDLLYSARKSKFLYSGQPHVGRIMRVDTRPTVPVFPYERYTFPTASTTTTGHTFRYPSLLYRQPFVFSPAEPSEDASLFAMESSGALKREVLLNPSFERWGSRRGPAAPNGEELPDSFTYEQGGRGGTVRRNSSPEFVREGRLSAALYPSSSGNSMMRQYVENPSSLRGRVVRFSVWVKSANVAANGIQIDIQTQEQSLGLRSYGNTGEWERLYVAAFLPDSTREVIVTMNVKQRATAPAFFDNVLLEVSATDYLREAIGFEAALRSRRNSSLMLKRTYVELIHADMPAHIKSIMFSVGLPMVRLLEGVIEIDSREVGAAFRRMGAHGDAIVRRVAVVEPGEGRRAEQRGARIVTELSPQMKAIADGPCQRGLVELTTYTYDRAEFVVRADTVCVLYWADAYDRRWRAFVNGQESSVFRANINFKAVVVPPGRSEVRFEYAPTLFQAGLGIYYASLAVSILCALVSKTWLARRKRALVAAEVAVKS